MTYKQNLYPAYQDAAAPHGWTTHEGFYYRPDWGDRLIEQDGFYFIEVGLGATDATVDLFEPIAVSTISENLVNELQDILQPSDVPVVTLQQFQAEWGLA